MMDFEPLTYSHSFAVAQLHIRCLRGKFRGVAGEKLLSRYYQSLIVSGGGYGFVAVEDGSVAGFVCGIWSPAAVYSTLVKYHWAGLMFWSIVQMISHPLLFAELPRRVFLTFKSPNKKQRQSGYELRPIVVAPRFRGTGTAGRLVDIIITHAANVGFNTIFLYTEPDNIVANAFYRKKGFKLMNSNQDTALSFNRYSISTNECK